MSRANRLGFLGIGIAVGSLATAMALAQPKAANDEDSNAKNFTAFPEITVPMKQVDGGKEPAPDHDKILSRFKAKHPRPIPADAAPLIKVRTAQVNEGVFYLLRMQVRLQIGQFRDEEVRELIRLAADLFQIAAELEPTVAGKRGYYQDQVAFFKEIERFTAKRVRTGTAAPHQLNLARFYRLEAEAELIKFQQSLGGDK